MSAPIPREARELLTSEPRIAFLGTCREEKPHVAPLWYNYYEGHIEVATTGRKLANLRENDRVAISVQKDVDGSPQWGVTVQGRAEIVEDDEAGRELIRRINRRYGADEDAWTDNTPVRIAPATTAHWTY